MSIFKEKYEERLNNWLLEKKEYIKEQSYIKYYTVIKKNIISNCFYSFQSHKYRLQVWVSRCWNASQNII